MPFPKQGCGFGVIVNGCLRQSEFLGGYVVKTFILVPLTHETDIAHANP